MRILIYTHEFVPFPGGVATYNRELATGLAELGQRVLVLAPHYDSFGKPTGVNYAIRRFGRCKNPLLRMLWSTVALLRAWWEFRPDVILVTERYAHISAALARSLHPMQCVPVVIGTEISRHFTSDAFLRRLRARLMKRFFSDCERIICISEFTRDLLLSNLRLDQRKVVTVYIGIDRPDLIRLGDLDSLRQSVKLREDDKVILTLARLAPRKGQDRVLEALPRILAEFPNTKYLMVGQGAYRKVLEEKAKDLGLLDSSVFFTGRVPDEDVPLYYALCDVFVMPSRSDDDGVEGFGISFVEAWQAGKPVVAGDHGGAKEVVVDNESGFLVDPESAAEIAGVVCMLLEDDQLAKRVGAAGRQRAEEVFSRETMARKTLDVLSQALLPAG